ncbi:unnamed protein product, partial [Laminaria digitata]
MYKRSLAIREKIMGPEHPEVAILLSNSAGWLKGQGSFAEAEPLYKRLVAILEKMVGAEDPVVVTTLNNQALSLE